MTSNTINYIEVFIFLFIGPKFLRIRITSPSTTWDVLPAITFQQQCHFQNHNALPLKAAVGALALRINSCSSLSPY